MAEIEQLNVKLAIGDTETSGSVSLCRWSRSERFLRAMRSLLVWGVLGVLSIAIPVVHLVSVPLLFLLGIFIASIKYSTESSILGGSGICPGCSAQFRIEAGRGSWPLQDVCEQCRRHVLVMKT